MRIVFHLCLLAACAMSSGIALATSHGHRPNAAAVRSRSLSDDAVKFPVNPAEPTGAMPSSSAGGGKGGDAAAPIDTSITVNQGHPRVTGKDSAAKKLNIAFGAPPAKPHAAHVVARRNAVGAAVNILWRRHRCQSPRHRACRRPQAGPPVRRLGNAFTKAYRDANIKIIGCRICQALDR
jgi:hypothetical protein